MSESGLTNTNIITHILKRELVMQQMY